ncbi:hypothetical protein D3C87_1917690 [compost metagenome]
MQLLYSHSNRVDFLHKFGSDMRSNRPAAGAGRKDANVVLLDFRKFAADNKQ